jgi:outer membrane protein TolC
MLRPQSLFPGILAFFVHAGVAYCAALQAADPVPPPGAHRPLAPGEPLPLDRLRWHIPDPEHDRQNAQQLLEDARTRGDKAQATQTTRVLQRLEEIHRPVQLNLTLDEAIRNALEHNYDIEVASFDPAIQTTRVVEAQSAFDAVFFTSINKNNIDRPSGSQLTATDLDLFTSSYGVRKALPSGMTASAAYQLNRTKTVSQFQGINPEYTSNFVLEMRQPMLRGFGLDYNRSMIMIARNDRRISQSTFERKVRDTLRLVDEYYWRLVEARRDIVITARLLAEFEAIYEYLEARQQFDITPVQLAATLANLQQARADFVRRRANVFDAQDRLVSVMNANNINLADSTEIIPEGLPQTPQIVIDRLAEVQTALQFRSDLREQELRVASAQILVGRAKNDEMPRFDLTWRTTFDGLGQNADRSFDQLTSGKFIEYFIGVELEIPIGNRGPKAAHHRARLQYEQQAAQLQSTFEKVILDVNLVVRALQTAFDQIAPSYEAAEAREREVQSIVARAERKDINTLTTELNARQSLAGARRAMLGAMVNYNIAIADLERAKGTLLQFHNVIIPDETARDAAPTEGP